MEKIREFIKNYKLIKRKNQYWYTNVYENITHELACMEFVEKHLEMLEHAVEEYAAECTKKETFLRDWLLYGIQLTSKYVSDTSLPLSADIKKVWPIFYSDSAEPFFEKYEISYNNTCERQHDMKKMSSIYQCNDNEILAIHKNKKCDCMFMCSYCEEMEIAWENKVKNSYSCSTNIFLYPKLQSEFVEKWLVAHPTYSDYAWPPTKVYYQGDTYRSSYTKPITDFAEMCNYIKESRKKYKEGGKTPLQCHDELCCDIQGIFDYIHLTDSDVTIFMKLWNKLDLVPIWLNYDKARCKEILKMF